VTIQLICNSETQWWLFNGCGVSGQLCSVACNQPRLMHAGDLKHEKPSVLWLKRSWPGWHAVSDMILMSGLPVHIPITLFPSALESWPQQWTQLREGEGEGWRSCRRKLSRRSWLSLSLQCQAIVWLWCILADEDVSMRLWLMKRLERAGRTRRAGAWPQWLAWRLALAYQLQSSCGWLASMARNQSISIKMAYRKYRNENQYQLMSCVMK